MSRRPNTRQRSWDNYRDPNTGLMDQSRQRSWDNYRDPKSGLHSAMEKLMYEENPRDKWRRKGRRPPEKKN
jgi:hypothetical protein